EIKLARTAADAESGTNIPFAAYPTLTGMVNGNSLTVPVTTVDPTTGTIHFGYNPGFTDGEALTFAPVAGKKIGGPAAGTYYAVLDPAPPNSLRPSASPPTGDVDGAPVPLNLDPSFQGYRQSLAVTLNPAGLPAGSLKFGFTTGFQFGDHFVYQGTG